MVDMIMEEVAGNLDQEAAGELVAEEEQLEPEEALEALALPTGPITRIFLGLFPYNSENEDEEDSNKSLSESLLEQIKKLMRDEFDRREQVKEGKRKESRDHIHISDKERRKTLWPQEGWPMSKPIPTTTVATPL
ncbi:unnamed protein product [Microthlaspi erraticum]|uniref:Uncharacterized protein n=1 Tax=Microthlaspi erraticum TaxID=1685480 RepID=A0A6D2LLV7_9BRAS|nr:unnamed protein product [Microthlaspi erraticum]